MATAFSIILPLLAFSLGLVVIYYSLRLVIALIDWLNRH